MTAFAGGGDDTDTIHLMAMNQVSTPSRNRIGGRPIWIKNGCQRMVGLSSCRYDIADRYDSAAELVGGKPEVGITVGAVTVMIALAIIPDFNMLFFMIVPHENMRE